MVHTDPIADMLTRIRNAIMVNMPQISLPYSKLKHTIASELKRSQFIENVSVEGAGLSRKLIIDINQPGTNSKITVLEKISRPGRRMYAKADEIPTVKNGRGIVLISTSQGIMTGREAKRKRVGGELICKVY